MNSSAILDRLASSPLETVQLEFGHSRALLTLQGAHLISYKQSGEERLWMSPKTLFEPNQPIRGGVPICWPWFGPHGTDSIRPAHGFARTSSWQLLEQSSTPESAMLRLGFSSTDTDYPLEAEYQIELTRHSLEMRLISRNVGEQAVELTEALHTYLPVSDLENASLHGLAGVRYADKLLDYEQALESREAVYLTNPTDRVYYDTSEQLDLTDTGTGATTEIAKQGSGTTVVWNAGEEIAAGMADLGAENYRGYICVEAANALEASINLEPGQSHTLMQRLTTK